MDLNTFKEYLNIHLISLTQDLDSLHSKDEDYPYVEGQVNLTKHLIEVLNDN